MTTITWKNALENITLSANPNKEERLVTLKIRPKNGRRKTYKDKYDVKNVQVRIPISAHLNKK